MANSSSRATENYLPFRPTSCKGANTLGGCSLTCVSIAVAFALLPVGCGGAAVLACADASAAACVDTGETARADVGRSARTGAEDTARDALVRREIVPLLREGDVVFRRGGGVVSRAVLTADRGGMYSHVGVVARVGGEFVVVHVVPGGSGRARDMTRIETPEEFFSPRNASRGAVMRLRDAGNTASVGGEAGNVGGVDSASSDFANALTESEIARQAAQSAVKLARAGTLFDHDYDLADTSRMYCTELVWHVFRGGGVDLSGGRRTRVNLPGMVGDYIMPSDIHSAPELEPIHTF